MAEGNGENDTSNTPEVNLNVDPTAFVDDVYNAVRWTIGWNDNDFERSSISVFFLRSWIICCLLLSKIHTVGGATLCDWL